MLAEDEADIQAVSVSVNSICHLTTDKYLNVTKCEEFESIQVFFCQFLPL